ncbi:Ger(x)C family spore germination protein [Paenibacillus sepulcri]|uniref:Ger(X)C family spore germination protein n=1 Tax=Paenibacillus sepulcri TaxID=359917 RepID=A0ABS7C1M9_9BACL|nr:Ger(x)C family spore germination protein [Paenibacillus sepulcri]
MKWKCKMAVCILVLVLSTGCWDSKIIQNYMYISALGIDYKDKEYTVYFQFMDLAGISKSESGSSSQPKNTTWTGKAAGPTLNMAFYNMIKLSQQPILWSHIKMMVFTPAALEIGIMPLSKGVTGQRDLRYTSQLYGTQSNLEELFSIPTNSNTTLINSLLMRPGLVLKQYSYFKPVNLQDFLLNANKNYATFAIPVVAIKEGAWSKSESGKDQSTPVIDGVMMLRGEKYRGSFDGATVSGMRWLNKEAIIDPLLLKKGDRNVAILQIERPKVKIQFANLDKKPAFSLHLRFSATVVEMLSSENEAELKRLAEQQIKADILDTFKATIVKDVDLFNVEEIFHRKHQKQWKEWFQNNHFRWNKDSLTSINVTIKLKHAGTNYLGE